jgi:hypothetical protein
MDLQWQSGASVGGIAGEIRKIRTFPRCDFIECVAGCLTDQSIPPRGTGLTELLAVTKGWEGLHASAQKGRKERPIFARHAREEIRTEHAGCGWAYSQTACLFAERLRGCLRRSWSGASGGFFAGREMALLLTAG